MDSRIRQYAEFKAQQRLSEGKIASLEYLLEEEERRNIRLSNQLLDEVALRARAERSLKDLQQEYDTITLKLEEMEGKKNAQFTERETGDGESGERPGDGGTVLDGVQRADGGPAPQRKGNAKPANRGSRSSKTRSKSDDQPGGSEPDPTDKPEPRGNTSSRVRGNVK